MPWSLFTQAGFASNVTDGTSFLYAHLNSLRNENISSNTDT